jgi:RNA polymerase sigma factor (sigma-70 family)
LVFADLTAKLMLTDIVSLASNPTLTDEDIITHVLHGQPQKYEILVRRYNNMLYKTARGILVKEADIEDAMQEAYLLGFEKLHQFRKEAKFSTWLTRILINCALKQVNKIKKDPLRLGEIDSDDLAQLEISDEVTPHPEISENLKKAVEAAIEQLPAKYRLVFMLREIENTSTADAAAILGISEENVKIRLHRAKGMLKEILQTESHSLEIFEFRAPRCEALARRVMNQINTILPRDNNT